MTHRRIELAPVIGDIAKTILCYLNEDVVLAESIGHKQHPPMSEKEFIGLYQTWMQHTESRIFAITLNDRAVGIITLSHIDIEARTARTEFWIATNYFEREIARRALHLIFEQANHLGISEVHSSVHKIDTEACRLWNEICTSSREEPETMHFLVQVATPFNHSLSLVNSVTAE